MTQSYTHNLPRDGGESKILAKFLTGRYGALALTRAAGEAAAARRRGDDERHALWRTVICDLRRTMSFIEASEAGAQA